jgi:hypothetical protein
MAASIRRIKLPGPDGLEAIVDTGDFKLVSPYTWCKRPVRNTVYVQASVPRGDGKRTSILMHRLIMKAKIGQIVDHVDGNGLNNRRSNLRICSHSQNMCNSRKPCTNVSGCKGVYYDEHRGKWKAQIMINQKGKHIGYYRDRDNAIKARREAERRLHGEFARSSPKF